jgi:hypothetical protein
MVFLVMFVVIGARYLLLSKGGRRFDIRRIAGLEAIDEAVGRATEMGRPVHLTFGSGPLDASVLAGFQILRATAGACARMGVPILVTVCQPETFPMAQEVIREAYIQASRQEDYRSDSVRFYSETQQGYTSGVLELIESEKPAANFMVGSFLAESLTIAECGNRVGAIQIGGTTQTAQLPFFVAACDYTLIGDEMFATGAYLSQAPDQIGVLAAEEMGKYLVIGLIVLGSLLSTFGVATLSRMVSR